MKDNLENFVRQNRQEFDNLDPRPTLWENIDQNLPKKKDWLNRAWKVAAVLLLGLLVGLLVERNLDWEQSTRVAVTKPDSNELQKVENYFVRLISFKRQEITAMIDQQSFVGRALLQDLDKLDAMYVGLKKDLETNQNNERLINAMIRNLQLRVEILNQQLDILEKINQYTSNEEVSL